MITREQIEQNKKKLKLPQPVEANQLAKLIDEKKISEKDASRMINSARPISSPETLTLVEEFLKHKKIDGTDKEKALYADMTAEEFVDRLLTHRPLAYFGSTDAYLLSDGSNGIGGFELIGTDKEKSPLELANYLSQDEILISAHIGISSETYFINDGNRYNGGTPTENEKHETTAMSYAMVGPRLETPGKSEWRHMIIDSYQNTAANGYGAKPTDSPQCRILGIFKHHYQVENFATYDEAKADYDAKGEDSRFIKITLEDDFFKKEHTNKDHLKHLGTHRDVYLDKEVYKEFLRQKIETYLSLFNEECKNAGKKGYAVYTGLGLGAWAIKSAEQCALTAEIFKDVLQENKGRFKHIKNVHFSHLPKSFEVALGDTTEINGIKLHCSDDPPAQKLTGKDKGKLVGAVYAWDGNSIVGNEYWANNIFPGKVTPLMPTLANSDDPATVAATTNSEVQNALINPLICGNRLVAANADKYQLPYETSATPTKAMSSINTSPRGKDDHAPTVTTDRPPPPWSACKFKDVKHSNNWDFGKPAKTGSVDRDITYKGEKQIVVNPASVTTLVIDKKAFIVALRIYQSANNDKKKLPTITTDSPEATKVWKEVLEKFYPHKNAAERDACVVPSKPKTSAIKPAADPDDIAKTPTVTNS